jgi:hypothetical protein
VIQETGRLRNVRWAIKCKGKSGGVRVIYFFVTAAAQIRLIAIYKKGVKDDLNAGEKKVLKNSTKIGRRHDGQKIVCRFGREHTTAQRDHCWDS